MRDDRRGELQPDGLDRCVCGEAELEEVQRRAVVPQKTPGRKMDGWMEGGREGSREGWSDWREESRCVIEAWYTRAKHGTPE